MSKRLDRINSDQRERLARDLEQYGHLLGQVTRAELRTAVWKQEGGNAPAVPFRCRLMLSWKAQGSPELTPGPPPAPESVRVSIIPSPDEDYLEINARGQSLVRNVAELLEAAEVDQDLWQVVGEPRINSWTTALAGPPGEDPRIVRNWQVSAKLSRRLALQDYKLPPVSIVRVGAPPVLVDHGDYEIGIVYPDAQIGYKRGDRGRLEPTHDVRALDAVMQLTEILQPNRCSWIGDNLDFAEISSFRKPAAMMDIARPGLAELRYWWARNRAAAPSALIESHEGNHEERVQRLIVEHMAGFATAKRPGESYPAFSLRALLQPEDFSIDYLAPYRQDASWWWDRVKIHHGETVRPKSGATVQSIAASAQFSEIVGHIHRLEVCHVTEETPHGIRTRFAASPGCLCRLAPGVVPGYKAVNNWQNGCAVVFYHKPTGQESIQLVPIHRGALWWGGRLIQGRDCIADVEAATGWPMAHDWLQPGE